MKILEMLLDQDGRRCEKDRLFSFHDALEYRAKSDLRLAEADIAAKKSVHHLLGFHIVLDIGYRGQLVLGLLEREVFLEFFLPYGIGCEYVPLYRAPLRVKRHQVDGELPDRGARLLLHAVPFLAAES